MPALDIGQIGGQIGEKLVEILSGHAKDVAQYAQAEGRKLATSLAEIATLRAQGKINDEEARLHLEIQKNASRAILMAIKGVGLIAAEQAINAALSIVRGAVNTAVGFDIL